jgi:hypothetical protein
MSVLASALINLTQFKAYLPDYTGGTKYDGLFEALIDSISEQFDGYVGRKLAKTTYTAVYFDGNRKDCLLLPQYPIVSIASIAEAGDALTEGEDNDYLLYADRGILKKVSGVWYKGSKTILITYTAGYTVQGANPGTGEVVLPADLKLACMIQVAREWKKNTLSEWGVISKSSPDGASVTKTETGLLKEVREILDRYRSFNL